MRNSGTWKLPGLVNVQKTMENHHFFNGKSTISMAIFNSYVSLPEGTISLWGQNVTANQLISHWQSPLKQPTHLPASWMHDSLLVLLLEDSVTCNICQNSSFSTMCPPFNICQFINFMNTTVRSTINPQHWSGKLISSQFSWVKQRTQGPFLGN